MENIYYVYVLFGPDGRPFYVGKGKNLRHREHIREARKLRTAKDRLISEMVAQGLDIPCVKIAQDLSEEAAYAMEVVYIDVIGRAPHGPLLNLCRGGYGAAKWTMRDDHLATLVACHKGKPKSDAHKKAIADALRGKPKTPEHVARLVASRAGYVATPEHRRKLSEANTRRYARLRAEKEQILQ